MKDKNTVLLLRILHEDGNINLLRHHNMSFKEIAELVEQSVDQNLLSNSGEIIALTELGIDFLKSNIGLVKERDKSKWIEPDKKNRIRKIERHEVFLPAQNALSFLK
jgi:hypothetical protein